MILRRRTVATGVSPVAVRPGPTDPALRRQAGRPSPRTNARIIEPARFAKPMPEGYSDSTMLPDQLRRCLDSPAEARSLLQNWKLRDLERGWHNLRHLADSRRRRPAAANCAILSVVCCRAAPTPDMALNNLERFLANPAGAAAAARPARKPRPARSKRCCSSSAPASSSATCSSPIPTTSTCCASRCAAAPARRSCSEQLQARGRRRLRGLGRAAGLPPLSPAADAAHRHQRHHPRSAARRDHPRHLARRRRRPRGRPRHAPCATSASASASRSPTAGEPARCVILAFGKLGGEELNYSSDIDLMFLYDEEGAHARQAHRQHRQRRVLRPRRRARSSACCPRTPTAARPTASICGCGPKDSAARWPARWPARCPTTTRWAAPGNGRPSSRSGPSPATCSSARSSCRPSSRSSIASISAFAEINEIKALEAAHRAEDRPGRRQRHRGQDRPRRHPRHRVHHPVPATAQRRRPARRPPAQHAPGHAGPRTTSAA